MINEKFRIDIVGDLDYEDLIAEIYFEDQISVMVTQEAGLGEACAAFGVLRLATAFLQKSILQRFFYRNLNKALEEKSCVSLSFLGKLWQATALQKQHKLRLALII